MAQSLWKLSPHGNSMTIWLFSMSWKHIIHLNFEKKLHKAFLHSRTIFFFFNQSKLKRCNSILVVKERWIFIVFILIKEKWYSFKANRVWFWFYWDKTIYQLVRFPPWFYHFWRAELKRKYFDSVHFLFALNLLLFLSELLFQLLVLLLRCHLIQWLLILVIEC